MASPGGNAALRRRRWHRALVLSMALPASHPAGFSHAGDAQTANPWATQLSTDFLKPFQSITYAPPPLSPDEFNPDSGVPPIRARPFDPARWSIKFERVISSALPPVPAPQFNPDPGAALKQPVIERPFFERNYGVTLKFEGEPIAPGLELPRSPLERPELRAVPPREPGARHGEEPLPDNQKLPRRFVRTNERIEHEWHNPHYPLSWQQYDFPDHTRPVPDRWDIGFAPWRRYTAGNIEQPYSSPTPWLWHPYEQSRLKGDLPVIGQDIFLNLTASSVTEFEARRLPTPSAISAARPGSAEFFGRSEQLGVQQYFGFAAELFEGEAAFKPFHWAIKVQPVFNFNYTEVRENNAVKADPRGTGSQDNTPPPDNSGVTNPGDIDSLLNGQLGVPPEDLAGSRHTTRFENFFALQEYFAELHLGDLSVNYDFWAARVGSQVFNADFRGFLFNDINTGARIFGNWDNNQWQYNLAYFDLREKDTTSDLNTFDARDQRVLIANLYRQDFLWKGYTAQLLFGANFDEGDRHYDENGNIARPAPLGTVRDHNVEAYYLGWSGDGHIGRLNLSHTFYQAFGRDGFNGLAGQEADINAQFAALELSYDRDWIRYKVSAVYASGDPDAEDGEANGFDVIIDNPNFTGGPFSYWVRQGFNLAGSAVQLKQRNSLVPSMRTSKFEGQANFVNPGVFLAGIGAEIEVTPRVRSFINVNYLQFAETDPIKTALLTDKVRRDIGFDLSIGFQWRPLLTDNLIISAGFGALIPGGGFKDIYRKSTDTVPGFIEAGSEGQTDDFLFSGLLAITLTY